MSEGQIRGYSFQQTGKYIQTQLPPELRDRVMGAIPAEVTQALETVDPAGWCPREHACALYRAMVSACNGDEKKAYDVLSGCGEFIASEATNTFLRLMMRILTPPLFAKKLVDLWKRDQTSGRFEVDTPEAEQRLVRLRLTDVEGYDHIGIVSVGWIRAGMLALGKETADVRQQGWSLAQPGPETISYEIRWS